MRSQNSVLGAVIIDVGAAPGSWCQVCADVVHSLNDKNGYVLGIDLQVFVKRNFV